MLPNDDSFPNAAGGSKQTAASKVLAGLPSKGYQEMTQWQYKKKVLHRMGLQECWLGSVVEQEHPCWYKHRSAVWLGFEDVVDNLRQ